MATPSKNVRPYRGGPVINRPLFEIEFAGYKTPCWIWKRKLLDTGYGYRIQQKYKSPMAHKQLWEMVNGEVPEGLELDHLCRVRACVRPDHLEAVTHAVNVQRGLVGKYTQEQMDACIEDVLIIGRKPAARKHGIHPARVGDIMRIKGIKSPLPTGRPKRVI